ncbi:LacI family transcriptional regulator [Bradyrhizobium sp. CIR48]|uniref:LacI family DNA-binding transcriptional regulator n=1 Tax=Bradyrhizobium sp. CIR48 TaxID=2663840 RepID=UPI0016060100|nr:LacI family DNA-binding transcriptional regulator [Bradyrhizobium sp. CIR48]MBB4423832.1 LacI family transcriptional regulator [Bradyrhizobium sp. CIR48]
MEGIKKPKLEDVARLAGVSLGSASRALSSPEAVRPATRDRVHEAAQQLGYVIQGAARALASRRSRTIGAILPTISNPIYADFVQALQRTLAERGYHLLVASHEYNLGNEVDAARGLIERGADGLVLVGGDHDPRLGRLIEAAGIPTLAAWSFDGRNGQSSVGVSDRTGAVLATRHLLALGHRRFAVLSGPTAGNERQKARVTGALEALAAHDVACPPEARIEAPFSLKAGAGLIEAIRRLDHAPTAVICCSDMLAIGLVYAASRAGIAIPREMSVTGFGDVEMAGLIDPPLTTVRVPIAEIGERSARAIVALIVGEEERIIEHVEVELLIRASTAEVTPEWHASRTHVLKREPRGEVSK